MQRKEPPAPLLIPVLAWCLGMLLAKTLPLAQIWLWMAAGLVFLFALLIKRTRALALIILCVVLGALRWQAVAVPSALDLVLESRGHVQQEAEFTVTKLLSKDGGIHEIQLEELAGVKVREPLTLIYSPELELGQSYQALLEVIPGTHDPLLDTFPARHRAYVRQGLTKLDKPRAAVPIALWRAKLLKNLDAKLGEDAYLAKALLLSDTQSKGEVREPLTRSGMIHLIVVSGLHIWFIYAALMVLLNFFFPRRVAEVVFLFLITFYAALNHWSPSVTRAILMIGLMIVSRWRGIRVGGAQLLALSLLIITALDPTQLFNIGLQLSFLCIGVIILGLPKIPWITEKDIPTELPRTKLNRLLDLLLLNLTVGLAVMPVTLFYFGTASLNGIVGNLLGIPLASVLLMVSFLVLLVPGGNWLSATYITAYKVIMRVFLGWMDLVASLPFYLENAWINWVQLVGAMLLVVGLLWMLRHLKFNWKTLPAVALGVFLLIYPRFVPQQEAGIYVFDCGTGDCILACFADGSKLMVDTGPKWHNSETSWATRKLLPWLKKQHIDKLDWLVLTHLDADHSGGFPDLAKHLKIENMAITDEIARDSRWEVWKQEGLLQGIDLLMITDTLSVYTGGARLKFLHPDKNFFVDSSNSGSILFRLDYRGKSYLFTGDADINAEAHLLAHYPQELKADFLKAGHHGSRTSSCREFVRAVNPEEVWITAGKRNQWGFPHPEPMSHFRRYAKRIRGTAEGSFFEPFAQKD